MNQNGKLKVVNIIDSCPNNNPIKILQNSQNSALFAFNEKIQFCLSSHRFFNWIITILFFILFILNSISRIFLTGRPLDSEFNPRDIIFFLCALRPEVAAPEDLEMAALISCISTLFFLILDIFLFSIHKKYYPILTNSLVIFMFGMAPLFISFNVNSFMQAYNLVGRITDPNTNKIYELTPLMIFCIVLHICIIIGFCCTFLYFSQTPRDIVHPLIPVSSYHTVYIILYFLIFIHISGFFYEYYTPLFMIRIIVGLAMLISHLYSPYYCNRLMNSLFMLVLLVEIVSSTVYSAFQDMGNTYKLTDYDPLKPYAYMDLRFCIIITSIPISFAISLIYFYFIFPLIGWKDKIHSIKNAYISGDNKRAYALLRNLKLGHVQSFNMHEIVKASLNLKYRGSEKLIRYFITNSRFLQTRLNIYYLWTSMNVIDLEINHTIPKPVIRTTIKYEMKINELEKQFWTEVYLSNLSHLPQISSKINNNFCFQFLSIESESKQCPKLLKTKYVPPRVAHQVRAAHKVGLFKKFFYNLSLFDLIFFICFAVCIVIHSFLLIGSKPKWNLITDSSIFLNFTKQFITFELSLYKWNFDSSKIDDLNLSNIRMNFFYLSKYYESLLNISNKPTADLMQTEYMNITLANQLDLFLDVFCSVPEFYHPSLGSYCPTKSNTQQQSASHADQLDSFSDFTSKELKQINPNQINQSDSNPLNQLDSSKSNKLNLNSNSDIKILNNGQSVSNKLKIKDLDTVKRQTVVDTINHLNYTIRSMPNSFQETVKPDIEMEFVCIYLLCIIFIIIFIIFVIIYFTVLKRKSLNFYLGFAMIRKSNLKQYQTESMKGMYQFRRKQTFPFITSYPWTSIASLCCFIGIVFQLILIIANYLGEEYNTDLILGMIRKMSHVQTIPLFFVSGFIIPNQTLVSISSRIVDEAFDYQYFIPNDIYTVFGQFLYNGYSMRLPSTELNMSQDWIREFEMIEQNIANTIHFYKYLYSYSLRRYISYFCCAVILYFIILAVQNKINFFMKREQEIWSRILHRFASKQTLSIDSDYSNHSDNIKHDDDSDSLEDIDQNQVQSNALASNANELPIEGVEQKNRNRKIRIDVIDADEEYEYDMNPEEPIPKMKLKYKPNSKSVWPGLIKSFDQNKIPLMFFGVDKNMKVIFSSNKNQHNAEKQLQTKSLREFLQDNIKELNKNCKQDVEIFWELPKKNGLAVPFLKFLSQENKFEVKYVVVVLVEDSATKVDQFQNRYESIFKSIYPSFMYQREMPATISTKQNYRMILLIKLYGFDDFRTRNQRAQPLSQSTPKRSIVNVDSARITIRRLISKALSQELEQQTYIHRIRETSSEIIITFDQENDKIAWSLIEFGTNISKFVFDTLKKLRLNLHKKMIRMNGQQNPNLDLSATALLYKAKVNEMIVTKEKESYMDFVGNILYEAEQLLSFCVPFHLNYVSTFNEKGKVKYTTKYKTITIERDSNMQKYDLFIGV